MAQPEQVVSRTIEPGVGARIAEDVYQLRRGDDSGALADYIPELAATQPDSARAARYAPAAQAPQSKLALLERLAAEAPMADGRGGPGNRGARR
ncbi:hypothetical protein OH799_12585 [Nocardia sp. NBC_00881]|uniref:hypothetical protein n=1 Tax=Nocardia sp. NBC_00881 TaxID=2975995 RepID=UPI00386D89E3|nr:hypothetical protein OH799_12585 [Nocardia sp. NBC_00881]